MNPLDTFSQFVCLSLHNITCLYCQTHTVHSIRQGKGTEWTNKETAQSVILVVICFTVLLLPFCCSKILWKCEENSVNKASAGKSSENLLKGHLLAELHRKSKDKLITFAGNPRTALYAEVGKTADHALPGFVDCKENTLLLIVVLSQPDSLLKRLSIRETWGDRENSVNRYLYEHEILRGVWKTVFVVGRPNDHDQETAKLVKIEKKLFRDVLTVDYAESFGNLTLKVLKSFEWVSNHCNAEYVLKTDDDCFVNVRVLLPWLDKLNSKYNYIGRVQSGMEVIRDKSNRYFVSKNDFPEHFYPDYCAGGGYILKAKLLSKIIEKSRQTKIISNEDAFIGVIMNMLGSLIHYKHDQRFLPFIYDNVNIGKLHPCQIKDAFVIHDVGEAHQLRLFFSDIFAVSYWFLCEDWGKEDTLLQRAPPSDDIPSYDHPISNGDLLFNEHP